MNGGQHDAPGVGAVRGVGLAGVVWGGVLLARGDSVWRAVEHRSPTAAAEVAIRALGIRHVVQGVLQVLAPARTRRPAVVVDVAHALSMLGLGIADPGPRRAAALTGGVALAGAAVTATAGRTHAVGAQ